MCDLQGDYDGGFNASTEIKRSRKPHRCDECNRVIKIGSSYRKTVGTYAGAFFATAPRPSTGCGAAGMAGPAGT